MFATSSLIPRLSSFRGPRKVFLEQFEKPGAVLVAHPNHRPFGCSPLGRRHREQQPSRQLGGLAVSREAFQRVEPEREGGVGALEDEDDAS